MTEDGLCAALVALGYGIEAGEGGWWLSANGRARWFATVELAHQAITTPSSLQEILQTTKGQAAERKTHRRRQFDEAQKKLADRDAEICRLRLEQLLALGLAVALAACSPGIYVTPTGGDVLPVEAGRIVAAASATAGAVATQVAQTTATDQSARATSTAARAGTLEAISDRQSLATLSAGETQDVYSATAAAATAQLQATAAAGDTQAASSIRATVTAAAATSTAALAATLAAEVVHREQQRTLIESATGGLWNLIQLLAAVAFMFGLFWLGGAINADLTRRRNNAALRETPLGPVIMLPGRDGPSSVRLLTTPAPATNEDEAEPDPEPTGEPILVTVKGKSAAPIVAEWRSPELSAERAEIAALVRAAIKVEGEGGTRIPRYARLPGWQTNPDGWKARTDTLMLAGHVIKSSGRNGGTFLTKNRTLYQLLAGLLDGSLPLRIVDVVGVDGQTLART